MWWCGIEHTDISISEVMRVRLRNALKDSHPMVIKTFTEAEARAT